MPESLETAVWSCLSLCTGYHWFSGLCKSKHLKQFTFIKKLFLESIHHDHSNSEGQSCSLYMVHSWSWFCTVFKFTNSSHNRLIYNCITVSEFIF
jgi:hypothetical protein